MIDALIAGRLYGKPQPRIDRNEKPFATAKLRTPMAGGESVFVNVVAFGERAATAVLALQDGDSVAMSGELSIKVYTGKDGVAKPSVDLIAHAVISEYHVVRKRRAMSESQPSEAPRSDESASRAQEGNR
jgi:single-stranded DNA-binding protein